MTHTRNTNGTHTHMHARTNAPTFAWDTHSTVEVAFSHVRYDPLEEGQTTAAILFLSRQPILPRSDSTCVVVDVLLRHACVKPHLSFHSNSIALSIQGAGAIRGGWMNESESIYGSITLEGRKEGEVEAK